MIFITFKLRNGREILINRNNIEAIKETESARAGKYTTNLIGISGTVYDVDESPEEVFKKLLPVTEAE
jgi:uncharacterized protein YlzI (FlbEa/FlbD family)